MIGPGFQNTHRRHRDAYHVWTQHPAAIQYQGRILNWNSVLLYLNQYLLGYFIFMIRRVEFSIFINIIFCFDNWLNFLKVAQMKLKGYIIKIQYWASVEVIYIQRCRGNLIVLVLHGAHSTLTLAVVKKYFGRVL